MRREIVLIGVLEDKDTLFSQDIALQHEWNNLLQPLQVIGCIGEDYIELFGAAAEIEESISLDDEHIICAKLLCGTAYKGVMHGIYLDRGNALGTS